MDLIDERVTAAAAEFGISPERLDWHVEAEHGWEPHDAGYEVAVRAAARCELEGGCR